MSPIGRYLPPIRPHAGAIYGIMGLWVHSGRKVPSKTQSLSLSLSRPRVITWFRRFPFLINSSRSYIIKTRITQFKRCGNFRHWNCANVRSPCVSWGAFEIIHNSIINTESLCYSCQTWEYTHNHIMIDVLKGLILSVITEIFILHCAPQQTKVTPPEKHTILKIVVNFGKKIN